LPLYVFYRPGFQKYAMGCFGVHMAIVQLGVKIIMFNLTLSKQTSIHIVVVKRDQCSLRGAAQRICQSCSNL